MSTKGKFRADLLLKLRRRREGLIRRHFSRAAGDAEATTRRLASLREALDANNRSLQEMLSHSPDPMNVRLYRQCIADLRLAIAEQEGRLSLAREAMERQRAELAEAIRQRKTLETLKDRQATRDAAAVRQGEAREWDQLHVAQIAGEQDSSASMTQEGEQ